MKGTIAPQIDHLRRRELVCSDTLGGYSVLLSGTSDRPGLDESSSHTHVHEVVRAF